MSGMDDKAGRSDVTKRHEVICGLSFRSLWSNRICPHDTDSGWRWFEYTKRTYHDEHLLC